MKSQNTIIVKDLVLVGGGHAHVQVLRNFGMKPMPGVRVTMIAREVAAPYSGRLPGLIAGHYGFDDAHIDLRRLARFAGAQFFNDTVKSIDLDAKKLVCGDRPPISFDVLSINSGSSPDMKGIPGAAEHTVPVKPIDELLARFEATKNRISTNAGPVRIGVVGAGAGGVELLLSLQHRLRQGLGDQEHIVCHLVTDADEILPTHNRSVRRAFARVLAARGVTVHTGRRVTAVEKRAGGPVLVCQGGFEIPLDHVFWATTASAPHWLEKTGLPLDEGGFIAVQDTLQSLVDPTVFAAGDIASVASHPRPKSGVFAVRQGPPLIRNIRRVLTGRAAKPFAPQKRFLSLISTGDRRAVASWGPIAASGTGIWKWKDWIDARFMEKFNDLPEMDDDDTLDLASGLASPETIAALGDHTMRCGGCGAKVGAGVLGRALDRLGVEDDGPVTIGLGQRDDAAVVATEPGRVMVHSVDGFRSFIDDPYLFGQIAANHALNDLFAMGATPQTALAIATLPFGLDAKVENDLGQMMAGAKQVLSANDTALVGGHTNEGLEMALSFAVNGTAEEKDILPKSGMGPGQRLILTKPVGTGALLAADMRARAKGRWIDAALACMLQSNAAAASCFAAHGATACTDVSGFGLLGHLGEMVDASGTSATLFLGALPILEGTVEVMADGITSSLQSQNEALDTAIEAPEHWTGHRAYGPLFDPQTAGGLLASLPADHAEACLIDLKRSGYDRAVIIGEVGLRDPAKRPIELKD